VTAPERDPQDVARTLGSWLERERGLTDVEIANVKIPGSTGFSNETILFDATWSDGGARHAHELVARIAPSSYRVFPDDTFELQFHVMDDLAASSVPTAAVHWLERDEHWFGQPFWIMERVDGLIPTDAPPYASAGWLADATFDEQARAWTSGIEALAAIHNLPLDQLAGAAEHLETDHDTTLAEIERYERFLEWAEDGVPHELARTALQWLRNHQPPAPEAGPTLVWGDSRLSNLVYRNFEVVAVLDWEMATIGDPLLDLGWWIFCDDTLTTGVGYPRLPGFDSAEVTAQKWSALTGRSTHALDYYLVFAGLRFTVIMLRMGKLLIDIGLVPPTFPYDNHISQGLAKQLRRA
jgi:aminoglycoside phosphotransferase (APT) family kinase protein